MRHYGRWAGEPKGHPEDKERCVAQVQHWPHHIRNQCSRRRGHGILGLFCKQHAANPANTYVPKDE